MAKKVILYVIIVTYCLLNGCSYSKLDCKIEYKDTIRNYKYDSFNNPTLFVGENLLESIDRYDCIIDRQYISKCMKIKDTIVFVVNPQFIGISEFKTKFQTKKEILSYYPSYEARFHDDLPISAYLTQGNNAMCFIADTDGFCYELEHMKICSENVMVGGLTIGLDMNLFLKIDSKLLNFKEVSSVVIIPTSLLFRKQQNDSKEVFEHAIHMSLDNGKIRELYLCDVGYDTLVETNYDSNSSCF